MSYSSVYHMLQLKKHEGFASLFCCMFCSMSRRRYFCSFDVIFLQFSDKNEISPREESRDDCIHQLGKRLLYRKKRVGAKRIKSFTLSWPGFLLVRCYGNTTEKCWPGMNRELTKISWFYSFAFILEKRNGREFILNRYNSVETIVRFSW